jgi:drug/metabolite transporter (DMT)-like permease
LWTILGIGALQILGQVSIYFVVANFKQHIFPLISTTRKMLTVILSIFLFHHDVNNWQWLSIAIVFSGMLYEFYEELQQQQHKHPKQPLEESEEEGSPRAKQE